MMKSTWKVAAAAASAALLLAASAQAVVQISADEATGAPGDTVAIEVSLTADPEIVAGTENVIGFDPTDIAIPPRSNGRPDCAVNPDIEKGGTAFAFGPSGCTGAACTTVKALVLALDNVDPIPNGVVMYTCQVAIAAAATAGDKTVSITAPGASDPAGAAIPATGQDGRVIVTGGASDADIIVGDGSGNAGDTIGVEVTLDTGTEVAGTENVIEFAAPLSIAARTSNGRPDCSVNPDIEKGGTAFAFQPSGCTGAACVSVKALVLALDNVDPIPSGSLLYTCMVAIAADAADGPYPLTCTAPGASDPAGGALNAACTSGTVTVGGGGEPSSTLASAISATDTSIPLVNASAFPDRGVIQIGDEQILYTGKDGNTLTGAERGVLGTSAAAHAAGDAVTLVDVPPVPTFTPTITPTVAPTSTSTVAPTSTRTVGPGGGGNDDDGCAVVAPAQSSNGWMLLLPAVALLWVRRRTR